LHARCEGPAYIGLRTSVALLNGIELWFVCGLIVAVAVLNKLLVSAVAVHTSGISWHESIGVGILVNTKGWWSWSF